jgi:plasmid replication initiation protein
MEENYLITKSNYFIMNCSYDLSLEEQKLILTLASMVQPEDEDFKTYRFRIADFMELLGVENKSKYTEIPKMTKELMKKVFEIQEGNKLIQTAWLNGAVYEKGSGEVELTFSSYLKPYMLKLNTMFTQYKLANILSMKSKYSPRIYEILKCNEFKKQGYIEIEVEDLRKLIRAENVYPLYANFKQKLLIVTQKELREKTDISFDFEEIKTGRKITSIKFYIKPNKKLNDPKVKKVKTAIDEIVADVEETPLDIIENDIKRIMDITNNEFNEKTVTLFRNLSEGNIDEIKKRYDYMNTKNANDNRAGYMISLLKNWEEPKQSSSTTSFNNFEPRKLEERYAYLRQECLLGHATKEEEEEFEKMRGLI